MEKGVNEDVLVVWTEEAKVMVEKMWLLGGLQDVGLSVTGGRTSGCGLQLSFRIQSDVVSLSAESFRWTTPGWSDVMLKCL